MQASWQQSHGTVVTMTATANWQHEHFNTTNHSDNSTLGSKSHQIMVMQNQCQQIAAQWWQVMATIHIFKNNQPWKW